MATTEAKIITEDERQVQHLIATGATARLKAQGYDAVIMSIYEGGFALLDADGGDIVEFATAAEVATFVNARVA